MTKEIKITAKNNGGQTEQVGFMSITFRQFISEETEMEDGEKVPKWEILIDPNHPTVKELEENKIDFWNWDRNPIANENYSYEISFTDDDSLLKKSAIIENVNEPPRQVVRDEDKRKRLFYPGINIAIKDNSYSAKIEQLKNQTNLMREEQGLWKNFISNFRQKISQVEDKNSAKYKEGRKFVEELQAELDKKTGKGNDDNREREREQNCQTPQTNWGIRTHP